MDQPGVLAGLIFMAVGILGLFASAGLAFGNLAMMGPGFMPRTLSIAVLVVGAIVLARGFLSRKAVRVGGANMRAVCCILLAVAGFAVINTYFGYLAAATFLVVMSAVARPGRRPIETILLVVTLCIVTTLIFIVGLGVQLRMF